MENTNSFKVGDMVNWWRWDSSNGNSLIGAIVVKVGKKRLTLQTFDDNIKFDDDFKEENRLAQITKKYYYTWDGAEPDQKTKCVSPKNCRIVKNKKFYSYHTALAERTKRNKK